MPLGVLLGVEPDEQRRVAEHRVQQPAERGAAERAEGLILPPHQGEVVDLEVAGGEVVVPHQGQPLGQRVGAEEHAVDPPALEAIGLGRGQRQVGQAVGERGEVRGDAAGSGLALQQPVDRRLGAVLQVALELVPGGGEAGPAVQVDDPAEVPGRGGVRDIGRPRVARGLSHRWSPRGADHSGTGLTFTSPTSLTSPGWIVISRKALPASRRKPGRVLLPTKIDDFRPGRSPSITNRPSAPEV